MDPGTQATAMSLGLRFCLSALPSATLALFSGRLYPSGTTMVASNDWLTSIQLRASGKEGALSSSLSCLNPEICWLSLGHIPILEITTVGGGTPCSYLARLGGHTMPWN